MNIRNNVHSKMDRQRKNLVICVVGDSSYHKHWAAAKNRKFDIMLVYYDITKDKYKDDADYYLQTSGMFKLENISAAIKRYYEIVNCYDSVFLPDDDMIISTSDINRLFGIFYKYELDIAQPTTNFGQSKLIEKTRHGYILRYTNFVSIGCPIFKTKILLEILPMFTLNRSGWGIEYLWCENHKDKKIAMIDGVSLAHKADTIRPHKMRWHYAEQLRKAGVSAEEELNILVERYKIDCTKRVYGSIRYPIVIYLLEYLKGKLFWFVYFVFWCLDKLRNLPKKVFPGLP